MHGTFGLMGAEYLRPPTTWARQAVLLTIYGWQFNGAPFDTLVNEVDAIPTAKDSKTCARPVPQGNHQQHLPPVTSDHIEAFFGKHAPECTHQSRQA
ncbi:MAG: hypothetical protein ACI8UD_004043 [Planctomycetota bacterium]|jgi:hypothetical protein